MHNCMFITISWCECFVRFHFLRLLPQFNDASNGTNQEFKERINFTDYRVECDKRKKVTHIPTSHMVPTALKTTHETIYDDLDDEHSTFEIFEMK